MTDLPITLKPQVKTALYRHFGEGDVLLYVGISLRPIMRTYDHARDAEWADQIVKITIERFDTRYQAELAERKAIKNEKPLHNKLRPTYAPPREVTMAEMEAAVSVIGRR